MNAHHHELYSHAIGASGSVAAYGHYGRPVLAFPSEGGKAYNWQDNGMIDTLSDLLDGGPDQALLRRLLRRDVVVEPVGPARGARAPARPLRIVDPRRRGAVHPARHGRRDHHHRDLARRVPRRQLRPEARGPVPAGDLHVGQLRPVDLERLGRARRAPPTSTTRSTTSGSSKATTSTGSVRGSACCWSAARASGRTPPGRWNRPSVSPACSPRRGSATSSTCGATTSRTTGRPGAPRSPTISRGSADVFRSPDRPAARHRGGLAARLRDAAGADRAGEVRRRDAQPDVRADHDRAVRPARQAALRPRRRPARLVVLRPARVAEEGRADG